MLILSNCYAEEENSVNRSVRIVTGLRDGQARAALGLIQLPYYVLTPWSRVLLEKLTVSQPVQKLFMEPEVSVPHS